MSWRQTDIPPMKDIEKGRYLTPRSSGGVGEFDVITATWEHVCSCRFGAARNSDIGCKWSGDSYRYDIFREKGDGANRVALRWWNGGGEGWLVDSDFARRDEKHILTFAIECKLEWQRWDLCHKLWETAHYNRVSGENSECDRLFKAFCEGKLKKRKRGGVYRMEILP